MSITHSKTARFAVAIALALILLGAGAAVLSVPSAEAGRPVDDLAYDHFLFLPAVARAWPSASGVYSTVSTGLVHNCAITPSLPPPMFVTVTQATTNLIMVFPTGPATGTINIDTGAFNVLQKLPVHPQACPGGCDRTTSGTFQRQGAPITFSATTQFSVLKKDGTVLCSFSFNQQGTRK